MMQGTEKCGAAPSAPRVDSQHQHQHQRLDQQCCHNHYHADDEGEHLYNQLQVVSSPNVYFTLVFLLLPI